MAMLYATMLGFRHDVLRDPGAVAEFTNLIQSPPDFTDSGIRRAVERVIHDTDTFYKSEPYKAMIRGLHGKENMHLRAFLGPFPKAVHEFGVKKVLAASGFDLEHLLRKATVERRNADIRAIFDKLDEEHRDIAPLIVQARSNGREKYGNLGYNEFFEELQRFLTIQFGVNGLTFFRNYHPLKICASHVENWY